jgi:hypothetical protein
VKTAVRAAAVALAAALATAAVAATAADAPDADGARDALRGALQLREVPLTVHASCRRAGPAAADRTVGDYLAGLLAAMDKPSNTVQAGCEPGPGRGRTCTLWLRHRDDEDRWAWGLAFRLDVRKQALPATVRCLGAG